jgi:two-component system sensor histidine kinase CpxA
VTIQSPRGGPKARGPIHRLFVKVFLWFWLAVLALFAIFFASRMLGSRVLPATDVIAAFAPRVADEAAHAYEFGGPQEFEQFERGLMGNSDGVLYLIDGYGKDVLSRPIPSDSLSIVRAARSDGGIMARYGLRSRSASYRFTSPSGHPYVLLLHVRLKLGKFLEATAGGGLPFFGVVLLMVTLFCFWLAHHIVAPIQGIQSAARRVATGDLTVRAPVEISKRHDELAFLAADFDAMVERISALVRSQKDLLSTVSHELRSPLTRFNMALALLRKQSPPESEELLQRMERDVERVDVLMGQLLTLSRLEMGLSSDERDNVDLSQLVQEVVADGDFEAHSCGKSVRLEAVGDVFIEKADQQVLRSACENIIRNAIRFTPPGTQVEVVLKAETRSDFPQAVLSVRDYGPGVPEQALQQIFQPFFRVKAPPGPTQNYGTGLGLAIVLEAIRQHRGTIIASNASPTGLEVKIMLPTCSL